MSACRRNCAAGDWDRYHARQDACAEKDRIAAECAQGYCDELRRKYADRECSAFGPLGDRRPAKPKGLKSHSPTA